MSKKIPFKLMTLSVVMFNMLSTANAESKAYDSLGIKAGGFIITPSIESNNEWTDNIYLTQEDEVSDFIFHIKPQLNISSDWDNHLLELNVGSNIAFYASNSTEEKQDYFINLLGRLDVLKNSFATAEFSYSHQTEDRGSSDSKAGATTPTEYDTLGGKLAYEHTFNRIRINAEHEITHKSYENTSNGAGTTLQNDARNRYENRSEIRLGYELFTGYEAYVKGGYSFINYDNVFTAQNNLDRSSDGYNIAAGMTVELTNLLIVDGYAGYQARHYNAGGNTAGFSGGLNLAWLATRLTTVNLGLNRSIQETSLDDASGYFRTGAVLSINHELKRNILLDAYVSYDFNEYEGNLNREEDLYGAGASLKYLINRNFYLKTGYNYRGRATNLDTSDYDANSVYFTVGAQL